MSGACEECGTGTDERFYQFDLWICEECLLGGWPHYPQDRIPAPGLEGEDL